MLVKFRAGNGWHYQLESPANCESLSLSLFILVPNLAYSHHLYPIYASNNTADDGEHQHKKECYHNAEDGNQALLRSPHKGLLFLCTIVVCLIVHVCTVLAAAVCVISICVVGRRWRWRPGWGVDVLLTILQLS